MSRDLALTLALSAALAAWVTVHVALAVGLLRRPPRWRGVVAFFVAPVAPFLGFAAKLRVRSVMWLAFAIAYALLRWRAYRGAT
jgi:hypothetical protein